MREIAAVGTLIFGTSLVQLANGYLGTLVSMQVASLHFGARLDGVILAAYYAGYTLGAARAGRIIERVGHIRAFAALAGILGAAAAMQPVLPSALFWIIARLATGFGVAGLFLATESWLNAKVSSTSRGFIFALYMVATSATFGGGQFLLNIGDAQGHTLFSLAAALFCLALIPVSTTRAEAPNLPPAPHLSLRELRQLAPVSVFGCAAAGIVGSSYFALVPAYGTVEGLSASTISTLVATAIFGGLAFQVPVGRLSDRFDRRLVAGLLGIGIGLTALAFVALTPHGFVPLVLNFLFGGFMSTLYPVCVAHANDRVPPERAVAVSGQLILISGMASCLGPIIGTWIMQHHNIDGVFLFMAALMVPFSLFSFVRVATRRSADGQPRQFRLLDQSIGQQIAHTADTTDAAAAAAATR